MLPVVEKEHPFKTGVRLNIASTLTPSGTSYLSFQSHRDGTGFFIKLHSRFTVVKRRYLIFKGNSIATYIAGDRSRTYTLFPVAKLLIENG